VGNDRSTVRELILDPADAKAMVGSFSLGLRAGTSPPAIQAVADGRRWRPTLATLDCVVHVTGHM
jgi:hypothetical protein